MPKPDLTLILTPFLKSRSAVVFKLEREVLKKVTGDGVLMPVQRKSSLSEIFHENTKLTPLSGRAYSLHIEQVGKSPTAKGLMAEPYKVYTLFDREKLTAPPPQNELEKLIVARRSERHYTGEAVSQEELARLLFYTYGRTELRRNFRPVASGGGLFPLEFYVVARNVTGLEHGIYHYDVENNYLDAVDRGDHWEALKRCVWFKDIDVDDAALVIIISAAFLRSTMKYQDRGYRMILMEAGEAAQNLSLLCIPLGLSACLLGGFLDDALSDLLGIDGVDEAPLLPIVIGRKQVRETAPSPGTEVGGW
jgi:SagB-type dehydrogenase family enzyme